MLVVVANNIPPAVRGRMKLWFIEPRPNIFVSGIKDSVSNTVVNYLFKYCPLSSGLIVFQKINQAPGYKIYTSGSKAFSLVDFSGLQLVLEKSGDLQKSV